uniref:Zinc finger, CCHC-type n=1 Tax=Tanacetum cinerariifolium TaxID=118510 RepID=A0A699KKF8_TANCI|nr:zinc finger, CCHC-type [Tanacetum cinerariifolium]
MLQMKEDETIDAFTTKLTTLVNKAASLGRTMEDGTLVRKLLNAVPDRGRERGRGRNRFSQGKNHENFKEERKEGETSHRSYDKNNFKKSTYDTNKVEEQEVSLHEENVGYKETNMDSLWYLDNGASNHMTGVREHFKELD